MEAIGVGASILTFITFAHSIHSALSAIKDGPEVIRLLADEIAKLESILQQLKKVSFVSIDDIDKSRLDCLAKKCKDDLAALDCQLKSLDVSASDGRRGRLWRKLKLCFSEKELDQIRNVVRGHVQHLGIRLDLIQAQQVSFTATQSTRAINLLQQLLKVNQDMMTRQTINTAALTAEGILPSTSARVTEVDDDEMNCSPDITLDESINRLMRLLEKKPCVVESDDSEELLEDLENLLECIRKDAEPVESESTCQNCRQDISKELSLMTNIILSAPTMMINQSEQGLDVDEVASRPDIEDQTTPLHISLMHGVAPEHYEALLYAGADITLQVRGPSTAIEWIANNDNEFSCLRMEQTLYISPFVYADSSDTRNQDLIPRVCVESYISLSSEPYQARRQIHYLLNKGYDINSFLQGKMGLHYLMTKDCLWLEYIPEYMDLLMFVMENGGDVWAVDDDGYLAAHCAYNITCEANYLFCPSAKGDLWDAALSYFGYDILRVRKHHPRKARYTSGYTRRDFERLWQGREGDCPYWDDQPWPSSRQNTTYPFQQPGRSNICKGCEICAMEPECFRCGVCLSSFEFFCEDDNHQHDRLCPREQVAAWELQEDDEEFYWELVPVSDSESDYDVSSSEDSEDGGILLQDRLEEAFSDASAEEVS
ncbi:hypothetical protein LZL87_009500 [Fusarium oxysporum]|nr:hypothetical protein LZL87_009500 [Fusarium oxysporum]